MPRDDTIILLALEAAKFGTVEAFNGDDMNVVENAREEGEVREGLEPLVGVVDTANDPKN